MVNTLPQQASLRDGEKIEVRMTAIKKVTNDMTYNEDHLQEIVDILEDAVVDSIITHWALCGGIAEEYYANPPATKDIDFFVNMPDKSIMGSVELYKYFLAKGATPYKHMVEYKGIVVDLIPKDDALHIEAMKKAEYRIVNNVEMLIIPIEYLAYIAINTGRDKDLVRAAKLIQYDSDNIKNKVELLMYNYPIGADKINNFIKFRKEYGRRVSWRR